MSKTSIDRRTILRGLAGLGASAALPDSIQKALAIPAAGTTGTIEDVKHIVVLMQENRSFDHYFGMLRGVRGYADPRAARLYGSGTPVFAQPNVNSAGAVQSPATILPYHPTAANLGQQFLGGLPHAWADAHAAWNSGRNDRWIPAKGKLSMAYLQRADIPFYYALADAFTICDAYHCSIMASTDPNRYYLWTGWCGQNGTAAGGIDVANTGSTAGTLVLNSSGGNAGNGTPPYGPVVNNAEAGYGWTTYPERLQKAGVSWKVYQDIGHGLNAAGSWGWDGINPYIGNYGDNSLLYFKQYQNAQPGDGALYDRARTGTNLLNGGAWNNGTLFDQLRADVLNGTLPQVSWIAAPEAYSEHSNWPTSYGTWYIQNVLNALTANPAVWASTVFIICFDENDGFFDHVVAPTPPASAAQGQSTVSTVNELYPGAGSYAAGPYGLGARVPMLVVSPWSKGGWVNSQVFDHTSILRFIEKRFGIAEPNISPWRRTVCGDLTSTLDFSLPNATAARLPSTAAYAAPQADIVGAKKYSSYVPAAPANQAMPAQERGQRLARALPYALAADWTPNADNRSFTLRFANSGAAGAWLHVRSPLRDTQAGGGNGPWGYTVEPGKSLTDTWTAPTTPDYDLSIHGPNGFYRGYAGSLEAGAAKLVGRLVEDKVSGGVALTISNAGSTATTVTVTDRYTQATSHQTLQPGSSFRSDWTLAGSARWYDLFVTADGDARFAAHFAGHVETGADGLSDPHLL